MNANSKRGEAMRRYVGVTLVALVMSGASAYAQTRDAILSPEETQQCLCLHQQLQEMAESGTAQYGMLTGLDREVENLRQQAKAGPPQPEALRALSRVIDVRNALRTAIRQGYSPPADSGAGGYDAYSQIYAQRCAGRMMRRADVEAFRANPVCPMPGRQ